MKLKKLKLIILKGIRYLDINNRKIKLSRKLNQSQRVAIGIFFKILKDSKTELYYDLLTSECYLSNNEKNLHIFIEDNNIKIINSVFSFDVTIDQNTQLYLVKRFELELNKRRITFKEKIISKTDNYLIQTYNKLVKDNYLP